MLSGGIFDSPLLATLLATVLVLVVGVVLNLVGPAGAPPRRGRGAAGRTPRADEPQTPAGASGRDRDPRPGGRVLQTGRTVARVLLVWAVSPVR